MATESQAENQPNANAQANEDEETRVTDIVVVGAGPAGMTAALYVFLLSGLAGGYYFLFIW